MPLACRQRKQACVCLQQVTTIDIAFLAAR